MSGTLTIRLDARERETLERAARERGTGLSAYVRGIAEREAHRLRREQIRNEGEAVMEYLAATPTAQAEIETYGTPIGSLL